MEPVSESERWVICPVCHKGNPAGTRFCQHCWGAVLHPDASITTEELEEANKRRQRYLRRRKIIKSASITLASCLLVGLIFGSLCTYSDIFMKPHAWVNSDPLPGEWTMFRHDLLHTGDAGTADITPTGIQKWAFSTNAAIQSSPAVSNGTVYFGSQDYSLYAVDAESGEKRWEFITGSWVDSSPVIAGGKIYFGSNDSYLYAVDAGSGSKVWAFKTEYPVKSTPAFADGKIYIRSDDYFLYAVDSEDGTEIWRYDTSSTTGSSPAVAGGIVYIGSGDGYTFALNAENGQRRLRFKTHYSVSSSPAARQGVVYFATDNGYLYAIDGSARTWLQEHEIRPFWVQAWLMGIPGVPTPPNQSGQLWGIRLQRGATASSPLIVGDTLYIGADNNLMAIDLLDHNIIWQFETGGTVSSSPALAGNAIVFGSDDGKLYAVDATTGSKLWDFTTGGMILSSPAVADGVIYVGSSDGKLYAIE
jgi:outer membrane protein assembly factor BamB